MTHAELTEAVRGSLHMEEQRQHRHDAPARGYQPATCVCSHPAGDHRTAGGYALHPAKHGICLIDGCSCQGFQMARTVPGTDRMA